MDQSLHGLSFIRQLLEQSCTDKARLVFAVLIAAFVWFVRNIIMGPRTQRIAGIGGAARCLNTAFGAVLLTVGLGIVANVVLALSACLPLCLGLSIVGLINGLLACAVFFVAKVILSMCGSPSDGDDTPPSGCANGTQVKGSSHRKDSSSGRAAASVITCLALGLSLLSGCYCMRAENVNQKACVVQRQEVNCATKDVQQMLPKFMPLVAWLLSGATGPVDTNETVAALEQTGFRFVGCSAAELERDFAVDGPGTSARVTAAMPTPMKALVASAEAVHPLHVGYHEGYQRWRARHGDVKFCFSDGGRTVCR